MRVLFCIFVVFGAALFLSSPPASAQEKRVALVIGNSEYRTISSIKNPVNDAADMSAALARLGFSVTTLSNATAGETRKALAVFESKAKEAIISLVFYSGHAVESGGVSWLIPTDGKADSLANISKDSVSLDQILTAMAGVKDVAVVMLDAGRNDPYPSEKSKPPAAQSGLPPIPSNVIVSYATRSGGQVGDGVGRNSPYTAALLKHIETEGLSLQKVMIRVRDDVMKVTDRGQEPFVYGAFSEDVFLAPR